MSSVPASPAPNPDDDKLLWHYTSAEGFLGILESGTLRLGSLAHMNDTSEIKYGLDLVHQAIDEAIKPIRVDVEHENDYRRALQEARERVDRTALRNAFAVSLSEKGDDLAQWRSYGRPGAGYAIGFDRHALQRTVYQNDRGSYFVPKLLQCIYDVDEQRREAARIGQMVAGAVGDQLPGPHLDGRSPSSVLAGRLADDLAMYLVPMLAPLKHPGFEAEKEWRLAILPTMYEPEPDAFRTSATMLVPFMNVPLRVEHYIETEPGKRERTRDRVLIHIEEVIVGPTAHMESAIASAKAALGRYEFKQNVRPSKLPFRPYY